MTETIWAVAAGEYSDYRIECLCRTETEAQAVADRLNRFQFLTVRRYLGLVFAALVLLLLVLALWT